MSGVRRESVSHASQTVCLSRGAECVVVRMCGCACVVVLRVVLIIILCPRCSPFCNVNNNYNDNNNNNNENPQLVVQLPPQSTTHKTLGVMIYTKDVSGKLALPQLRFFATEKGQTDTKGLQSGFFYLIHYNLLKRIL